MNQHQYHENLLLICRIWESYWLHGEFMTQNKHLTVCLEGWKCIPGKKTPVFTSIIWNEIQVTFENNGECAEAGDNIQTCVFVTPEELLHGFQRSISCSFLSPREARWHSLLHHFYLHSIIARAKPWIFNLMYCILYFIN